MNRRRNLVLSITSLAAAGVCAHFMVELMGPCGGWGLLLLPAFVFLALAALYFFIAVIADTVHLRKLEKQMFPDDPAS